MNAYHRTHADRIAVATLAASTHDRAAGVPKLAELLAFFAREAAQHPERPAFMVRQTEAGTPFRLLVARQSNPSRSVASGPLNGPVTTLPAASGFDGPRYVEAEQYRSARGGIAVRLVAPF